MPPKPKIADHEPSKLWALRPRVADFLNKFRYPIYGLFCLFFLLALFYAFAKFDPNTLFNSRQGFAAAMDQAFGPGNWRAGGYDYSYRTRTMTVKDLWVASPLGGPKGGEAVAHVGELAVSHLAWASDVKKLLAGKAPEGSPSLLASKAVAKKVRFMANAPAYSARGRLERLEFLNVRYDPNPARPNPGAAAKSTQSPGLNFGAWSGLRPERVELESLRASGRFTGSQASFALVLPTWAIVNPRLGPRGLVCSPGSLLAGLGFGLSAQGYSLSGRVDEIAHDGALALGAVDRLAVRNLAAWLEKAEGPASLDRAERKIKDPPWLELSLGDGAGQYLDFRPLAQRLALALAMDPVLGDPAGHSLHPLALLTPKDVFLGGISVYESRLNQLAVKSGPIAGQIDRAEISVTAGLEPYALAARLVDGWFSLAAPQGPAQPGWPGWPRLHAKAKDLGLLAGRFHLSGQAGFEPKTQAWQATGTLEAENLLGLTVSLELGGLSGPLYRSLGVVGLKDLLRAKRAPDGWRDVALQKAQLQLRDLGATGRFLDYFGQKNAQPGLSPERRRERVIFGLVLASALNLENYLENVKSLTDLLAEFLRKPGI
ncbi:MAG: hypothetical protein LBE01_03580, partial [Deltaproteobacteria bacterium]|nr:hypothetical protein [Deltaproteobacteria bacterium]